ncbi:MAG: O-antigen ligase family protein, partial [Methanobrevibacter sp.]|nr:O-antigen ligase family protein [Methanobrevibacter sp.]
MKNLIYKKFNILEIVLILSPIIDILTSVSQRTLNIDISLGLIIRSFLLFFMTMFTLIKSSYKYKKITITYLAMFILYSIFFMVNVYINKGSSYILAE